ncbi:MAG: Ig-like domain-containing protein [Clostridiales bacterium]|nr:Ig-like domain-containing protein [Clostridiales bacterium]
MKKNRMTKKFLCCLLTVLLTFSLVIPAFSVEAAQKKVTINYETYTLKKGKQVTLKASVDGKKTAASKFTWKSSNRSVANVSSKGVVKGLKTGKATITATLKGTKKSAKCKVIVGTPVSKLTVTPKQVTLEQGKQQQLNVTVAPKKASNKKVTYTSNNKKVAVVSSKGVITAKGAGTAKITVKATDGSGKKVVVTVKVKENETAPVTVASIIMDNLSSGTVLGVDEKLQIKTSILPENATDKRISFSSSDENIATVDANGMVTAVAPGTCNITAVAMDGGNATTSAQITVKQLVTDIKLGGVSEGKVLLQGETLQIYPEVLPENATNKELNYSSSNEDILEVDQNGLVTAKGLGKASVIVTAQDGSGVSAAVGIKVEESYLKLVKLALDTYDIECGYSKNVKFMATVDTNMSTDDVVLTVFDETDNQLLKLYDDGNGADDISGDGIFSGKTNIYADEVGVKGYRVKYETQKTDLTEICFYKQIEEESFEVAANINTALEEIENDNNLESDEQKLSALEEELKQQDGVVNGSIQTSDEEGTVCYTLESGINCIYELADATDVKGSGSEERGTQERSPEIISSNMAAIEQEISTSDIKAAKLSDKDIAVIRPYHGTQFTYNDYSDWGNVLKDEISGTIEVFDDEEAGFEVFKSLGEYGIVMIDSHGTLYKNQPYILTGEVGDFSTYFSGDYWSGRIVICNGNRLAVNADFFDKYYASNTFANTFVYLGTCYGGYNSSIADSLIASGADCVVGYDNTVSTSYDNGMLATIATTLCAEDSENQNTTNTLSKALETAKATNGVKDPNTGAVMHLYGDADFVLRSSEEENLGFEEELSGWHCVGDVRGVTRLSDVWPTEGERMAIVGTGLGSVSESDSQITKVVSNKAYHTLSFDYDFISEELMEFYQTMYNDQLVITLSGYEQGNYVTKTLVMESVNGSEWTYLGGNYFYGGDETTYHTGWKNTKIDISSFDSGSDLTISVKVWDEGDSIYDSAVAVDNFVFQ